MIIDQPVVSGSFNVTGSSTFVGNIVVTGSISATEGITISGSIASASYAANAEKLDGLDSTAFVLTSSYNVDSSSFSSRTSLIESKYATTGSNTFTGPQYISHASNAIGFTSTASLYTDGGLRVTKDAFVSGTLYLNNVTVYGTSSIQYITSSQVNIGTNIITVNTDTPAIRFGGLAVYDSGSTGLTGSILWDSEDNQWIYSNPSGSTYDSALFLVGPRNSGVLGNEVGINCNFLSKGNGLHHMTSSGIFENGTTTCFYGGTSVITANSITSSQITANSFTGSLFGTASNSVSASYALTASYASNVPETASYALQALSSSYALTASYSANVPVTASYALQALSSSYALTASYISGSGAGVGFPFSGSAVITGSLLISNLSGSGVRYVVTDENGLITAQTASTVLKTTQTYTASAGQTTFSVTNGYSTGYVDVFINGSKLNNTEFTDTSGTNVVLATGSFNNDIVEVVKYLPAQGVSNNVLRTLTTFTAAASQSTYTVSYTPGLIDIFYNGARLSPVEYTANNGTSFTLATASFAGDLIDVLVYSYQVGAYAGIGGSGQLNQVSYYTTTSSISGSNNFTFDGSTLRVTGSIITSGSSTFTNIGPTILSGSVAISGSITATGGITISGSVASAVTSSYPINVTGSLLYSTNPLAGIPNPSNVTDAILLGQDAGSGSNSANRSNFLGYRAGYVAPSANASNFLGYTAGFQATYASFSNFLGSGAGYGASFADTANFIGLEAGYCASGASQGNFIGATSGFRATNAYSAQFIGNYSGKNATNAYEANFVGYEAGSCAINANGANFLGFRAGLNAYCAQYSNFIGYRAGANNFGSTVGRNNIIIGTNISLADNVCDRINIGGVLFGTNTYFNTGDAVPFTGSVGNGRVGVNVVNPNYNLDVSGSGNFTNSLTVSGSLLATGSVTVTGCITATGQIVAQTLNVQQVTSSIVYSSGSNIFGNQLTNTQQFTGSVTMTGSLAVFTAGTSPEFQVTTAGTTKGNALTDVHNVTGSLRITGSVTTTGPLGGRYATFNAPTNGGYVTFEAGGTAFGDIGSYCAQYGTCDATTLLLGTRSGYSLVLGTSSTERFRIASNGVACFACDLTAKTIGTNDLILNNLNYECANYVDGTRGSWLIQEGACDLFIINQVSGKKYKFNLIEIK